MQNTQTPCGKCHRVLKNPASVERGYGPKCWASVQGDQAEHKKKLSNPADVSDFDYHYDRTGDEPVLVIIDLDQGGKSVTNNMESVLNKIAANEGIDIRLLAVPIVYRDSDGNFDGVKVDTSGAISIQPLVKAQRVTNEQDAVRAARHKNQKIAATEGEPA